VKDVLVPFPETLVPLMSHAGLDGAGSLSPKHRILGGFFVFALLEEFVFCTQQFFHVLQQCYILYEKVFFKDSCNNMYNFHPFSILKCVFKLSSIANKIDAGV